MEKVKQYRWKGITIHGKNCHGNLTAESKEDLRRKLFSKDISLIKANLKSSFQISFSNSVLNFFTPLGMFLDSGIDLVHSIELVAQRKGVKKIKHIIDELIINLKNGKSFANSLNMHPEIFSKIIIDIVSAGEQSGTLAYSCIKITELFSFKNKLYKNIKNSTIIPVITFIISSTLITLLFTFVVPKFQDILASIGKEPPWITKAVFNAGSLISGVIVPVVIALIVIFYFAAKRFKFLIYKPPILGTILYKLDIILFLHSMSILLDSGLSFRYALIHVSNNIRDVMSEKVFLLIKLIEEGNGLEFAMQKCNIFPDDLIAMVSIGESSGNLVPILKKTSLYFEEDLSSYLNLMTTFVQPLLICILGVILLLIILAIYSMIITITIGI